MFMETSALEGHNIDKAFALMIAGTDRLIQVRLFSPRNRKASEIVREQTQEQSKKRDPADY